MSRRITVDENYINKKYYNYKSLEPIPENYELLKEINKKKFIECNYKSGGFRLCCLDKDNNYLCDITCDYEGDTRRMFHCFIDLDETQELFDECMISCIPQHPLKKVLLFKGWNTGLARPFGIYDKKTIIKPNIISNIVKIRVCGMEEWIELERNFKTPRQCIDTICNKLEIEEKDIRRMYLKGPPHWLVGTKTQDQWDSLNGEIHLNHPTGFGYMEIKTEEQNKNLTTTSYDQIEIEMKQIE